MARQTRTLKADLAAIRADIAALQDSVGALASDSMAAGRSTGRRMAERSDDLQKQILSFSRGIGVNPAGYLQAGVTAVKRAAMDRPVQSALVVLGVGLLLGLLRQRPT